MMSGGPCAEYGEAPTPMAEIAIISGCTEVQLSAVKVGLKVSCGR